MSLVEGCGTYSGDKESGTVDWMGSAKGGGGTRLEGFGGGGNNDCGERGGRTNSVVTSSFGCEHEASRSSPLVIRAMVSLDGGGGAGGMSSVSKVCVGIIFLGGEPNLTLFLPFDLTSHSNRRPSFLFRRLRFHRGFRFPTRRRNQPLLQHRLDVRG